MEVSTKKRYNFESFLKDLRTSNNDFNVHKERLANEMLILRVGDVQIYSAEIFFILKSEDFKDEGFIKEYAKGFNNGRIHFKAEYKEDMSGLYSGDPKRYIEKLRYNYFEEAEDYPQGYKWSAESIPLTQRIDFFEKVGFASGVVYETDLMAKKNPNLFYDTDKTEVLDLSITTSSKSTAFEFENNFDHVPSKIVFNYFKKELVDKNYLSLDDLHKYLLAAFEDKKAPVDKFVLKGRFSIGIIRNIFYRYYTEIAQDKHGLKDKYCQLLGEYFNGFDTAKIKSNFNK